MENSKQLSITPFLLKISFHLRARYKLLPAEPCRIYEKQKCFANFSTFFLFSVCEEQWGHFLPNHLITQRKCEFCFSSLCSSCTMNKQQRLLFKYKHWRYALAGMCDAQAAFNAHLLAVALNKHWLTLHECITLNIVRRKLLIYTAWRALNRFGRVFASGNFLVKLFIMRNK